MQGLPDGQPFQAPQLGVHDQGLGFDDGRHRFAAMRDMGFGTAPVSMDAESLRNAQSLGLVRDVGATPATGSSVFTPSGRRVGVQYGIADASDLTASHLPDMRPNPDYPANLQPRDRSRAASDAQIADIAANMQPERLGASASAAEGAPIVRPDGIVESGNGRVLAIQRAHAQGGAQSAAYRDFLASQGYDTTGMKAPVLVRRRTSDLSPDDRIRFAQEANASPVLTQSATERAGADAGRLPDSALAHYGGGDVSSAENRPFVRSFLRDVAEKGEQGQFAAPDGALSLDGARRVQNALLHAGYGDHHLVQAMAETGDPDIAAFGKVMGDSAGRMAQLRRGIAAGDVHPGADVSAPVLEAGRVVQNARAKGLRLPDAVAQADAFNPISDAAHSVLKAAYGQNLSARLSRGRLGAYLDDAAGEAVQQSAEGRLFGEPLSAQQILEGAQARHAQRQTGTSDPVADGGLDLGARPGTAGQPGGRPGPGARGAGRTGPGDGSGILERPALAVSSDSAAAKTLRAAQDSHIDYQKRFVDGPLAEAIRTNGYDGQYEKLASSLPARAIRKGDTGYEVARSYLKDSDNDPAMLEALTHHALTPLRANLTPQGTVSPKAYETWRRDYGPALRALDEADPGFASRYDSAAHATDLMTRAGVMREQALDTYRKGVAGRFIGVTDPSEVEARVGTILNGKKDAVTNMRALVARLKNDPDAIDGLRRAGASVIAKQFSNATKEGASGDQSLSATKLPQFVQDHRAVLRELFDDKGVGRIEAVAHALDLKQRTVSATNNKGTSQTSQHSAPALKAVEKAGHGINMSIMLALAGERIGEHVFEHGMGALVSPEALLGATGLRASMR